MPTNGSGDGGYFSLNISFLVVTFGVIILGIGLWFAGGVAASKALYNAGEAAAFAAQAQAQQSPNATTSGFATTSWTLDPSIANSAGQTKWSESVQDYNLTQAFDNLRCTITLNGTNVVATVSGDYKPLFIRGIMTAFPALQKVGDVHMQKTITHEYYVANK